VLREFYTRHILARSVLSYDKLQTRWCRPKTLPTTFHRRN